MYITKYEHACLDIRIGEQRLVIDPGEFTSSFTDFSNIDAVVVTHVHGDHFDKEKLSKIIELNPSVKFYSTGEVSEQAPELKINMVRGGDSAKFGEFNLKFYGKDHAEIDPETPVAQNIGVLVNSDIYYPGDSYTICPEKYKVLAVPASGPWFKVSGPIPLIKESQCESIFPTHNALLSEIGQTSTNNWLEKFAERSNKKFKILKPGESIRI